MPYPTSILGGNPPRSSMVILYAGVQVLASLGQAALWAYPARNPTMMWPQIDTAITRQVTAQLLRTPVVFAISIPMALVSPWLGIASWALLVPSSILIERHFAGSPG